MKERQAKRRNNATRKDEKTKSSTRKDDKLTVLNGVFLHGVFSCWNFDFACGGFRYFVFSRGVISSFRMAFFRLFAWRHFVFSFFRVALFRGEKTKWHKPATILTVGTLCAQLLLQFCAEFFEDLQCFCYGLKMCMWFGYNPQINFCYLFRILNLVIFQA